MPAGLLVTVPEPGPDLETPRVFEPSVKDAVTVLVEVMVIVQLLPEGRSQLDQPEKDDPAEAEAVKVTTVL